MSKTCSSKNFSWVYTDQPHKARRRLMLEKYPEIKNFFGIDSNAKYWVILTVVVQLLSSYLIRNQNWWLILLVAYCWGGTLTHSLTLAIHEISHNLMLESPLNNTILGFVANLPMVVPYSVTFQKYHSIHHRRQGEFSEDPDLPTAWEGYFFSTPFLKAMFLIFQPLNYTLRPLLTKPLPLCTAECIQWCVQIVFDCILVSIIGRTSLAYLAASTLLGASLHPMAAHFIAEHYEWEKGYETYSYYGPLNYLTYNVGYHNEHHDFPRIAGSRLPLVKAMAPEFYDELPYHKSWVGAMWRFVFDPSFTPFNRVTRPTKQ